MVVANIEAKMNGERVIAPEGEIRDDERYNPHIQHQCKNQEQIFRGNVVSPEDLVQKDKSDDHHVCHTDQYQCLYRVPIPFGNCRMYMRSYTSSEIYNIVHLSLTALSFVRTGLFPEDYRVITSSCLSLLPDGR